ncbi:MAG: hypothetical protein AB1756_09845 [Acidobacteriota bacterium]
MYKKGTVSILFIILGFAIGWFSHLKLSEMQWQDYLLANWLERAGFHANALKLLQDQNFDRLKSLLLLREMLFLVLKVHSVPCNTESSGMKEAHTDKAQKSVSLRQVVAA